MAKSEHAQHSHGAVPLTVPQALSPSPFSKPKHKQDYGSDGVEDHDVFLLPASDYQVMLVLTIVAAATRVFQISQPTSVVFDEVQ